MNTIPNWLTLLRISLVPVLIFVYFLPIKGSHFAAAIVFLLASATDWLDGFLARYLKQTSKFGSFLDPVADKLIVAVALVLVVGEAQLPFLAVPAAVIVCREIVISALREWMAEIGKRTSIAVSRVGKTKTFFQMFALACLLYYRPETNIWIGIGGEILLYVAAGLTLWSMCMYIRTAYSEAMMAN